MAGGTSVEDTTRLRGELGRRVVHASGAVLPVAHVAGLVTWPQVTALLVAGTAVAALLEAVRLSTGLEWFVYQHLTREYEQEIVAGYALYLGSSAAVAVAFEATIAIPAILMLALADPLSGLASSGGLKRMKRPRALAVMFCVSAVVATPFVPPAVAVAGATAATAADGVTLAVGSRIIDDNLTIPLTAAVTMQTGQML
ncbi:MAG: Dolichol kinase [halophilic archaeon J07HX5]|jgi:Dolichol kinase|nr:MAG: Dolichol kinase [halophilic archaeon J07HX5]